MSVEEILPQDQQLIARGLEETICILEELEIPYILEGGTLLGAVREQRFLPWDDDVGIAVPSEVLFPLKEKLCKKLAESGFQLGSMDTSFENCKINAIKYGARYEILGWYLKGRWRRRLHYRMSRTFMEKLSRINLYGRDFICPDKPERFLRHFYGNWKKPRKQGRFFSFLCYDQKYYWKKQLKKLSRNKHRP